MRVTAFLLHLILVVPGSAFALFGDARPDAPELAQRGEFTVGVRTLDVVHPDQLDILLWNTQQPNPRYDRHLTLEIWYPTALKSDQLELTTYTDVLGAGANDPARPNTPFTFDGRAVRDAPVLAGRYPVVIVSHGYPGSRLQMSYLTEHLASHGYLVAAIDHQESTRADKAGFASTLLNRPLDDGFVLQRLDELGKAGSGSFLSSHVDATRSALLGYSMGGYGALVAGGVGVSEAAVNGPLVPGKALQVLHKPSADPRIKALVAFAPWGGRQGLYDTASLAQLGLPTLFVAGDQDDIAGYQDGVRRLFDGASNAQRYLLVYRNARHNVAPNPPSPAASSHPMDFAAYAEPVWDSARINNINQHFVLAFLDQYLKGVDRQAYLNLPVPAANAETSWHGFPPRSVVGLEWLAASPLQKENNP